MEKYKACPFCGRHQNPILLECADCEADLSNVPVQGEENAEAAERTGTARQVRTTGQAEATGQPEVVRQAGAAGGAEAGRVRYRFCECGFANLSNARKCKQCGEDIADILPQPEKVAAAELQLVSVDGAYRFFLTEDEITVGRNAAMAEYLKDKSYVSRIHARLSRRAEGWVVENLSRTNFTYINNEKIAPGTAAALQVGDEIGLGGLVREGSRQEEAAYFKVGESR